MVQDVGLDYSSTHRLGPFHPLGSVQKRDLQLILYPEKYTNCKNNSIVYSWYVPVFVQIRSSWLLSFEISLPNHYIDIQCEINFRCRLKLSLSTCNLVDETYGVSSVTVPVQLLITGSLFLSGLKTLWPRRHEWEVLWTRVLNDRERFEEFSGLRGRWVFTRRLKTPLCRRMDEHTRFSRSIRWRKSPVPPYTCIFCHTWLINTHSCPVGEGVRSGDTEGKVYTFSSNKPRLQPRDCRSKNFPPVNKMVVSFPFLNWLWPYTESGSKSERKPPHRLRTTLFIQKYIYFKNHLRM